MMLRQVHVQLRELLAPLGVEVGPEVLSVWRDREAHGADPLPVDALWRLGDLAHQIARERGAVPAGQSRVLRTIEDRGDGLECGLA